MASASVPAACREATVQAAVTLGTPGSVVTGLGSSAAALAQGIQLVMVWARLRSILLCVLGVAAITSGTWGWLRSGTGQAPLRQALVHRRYPRKISETGQSLRSRNPR